MDLHSGEMPTSAFLADARPRLERALVARFGVDDGLEAAAEAFVFATENWDRLRAMANPVGYLYRVGQSRGMRLRGRWRQTGLLIHEPVTTDTIVDLDLQRALMRLRPEQRIAIVLIHSHGYSYREAAEVLEIPVTTITNHVNRGMTRLRRIMKGHRT